MTPKDESSTIDDCPHETELSDSSAFEALVLRYQDRVFTLAYRMIRDRETALDISQEAFVKAFQGLGDFRQDSSFYTWLHRITINLCLTERRKRHVRRKLKLFSNQPGPPEDALAEADLVSPGPAPADAMSDSERAKVVREEVDRLDPELRDVIVLRDMEGLSYEDIAEALEIPVGTVRSRIHRGRDLLRQRLRRWLISA